MASMMFIMSLIMSIISLILLKYSMFISIEIPFMINDYWAIKMSLLFDWISSSFMTTVMLISSMILLYSMSYINNLQHNKFMMLMLMFVLSMILLILSNNMIFMLLGWDGLGISSYILVILYQDPKSASSGTITILSNRVGDALIIISISMMFMMSSWNFFFIQNYSKMILILLLLASCTKSAQFPFSAWLPAAMAAPTPISALVHSSTLVTAGVFLMIRLSFDSNMSIMIILMVISSMTAIYASMTACWEQDMKKIIAYSTLSQIAMMMFSISLNNYNLAFFHLITHALFKSMMFMTAGVMIMNSSYQDMRHMGSMMKNSPIISSTMGIAMFALMGIPFMSGFFSKDMIMEMFLKSSFIQMFSIIMTMSIGMTAMYSLRVMKLSFSTFMKSKLDNTFMSLNFMEKPLLFMIPLSIMSGSAISWMSFTTQNFILPLKLKFLILSILLTSMLFCSQMKFMSLNFLKWGMNAISIWFINLMSTVNFYKPMKLMKNSLEFDKSWQEMYGPYNTYNLVKMMSKKPHFTMKNPLFLLIMTTFLMMFILMFF